MIAIISRFATHWIGCCKTEKDLYMHSRLFVTLVASISVVAAMPLAAQHANNSVFSDHTIPGPVETSLPSEPGDGAFAAIAEIVAILFADPETDWTRVNIDSLREHLVDMNQLVLGASVRSEQIPRGLRMLIETAGRPGEAASRMVPSHGPVLAAETNWRSEVTVDGDEIVWTVMGADESAVARIKALGFFGLMATGDHHRLHHLAMARGESAH